MEALFCPIHGRRLIFNKWFFSQAVSINKKMYRAIKIWSIFYRGIFSRSDLPRDHYFAGTQDTRYMMCTFLSPLVIYIAGKRQICYPSNLYLSLHTQIMRYKWTQTNISIRRFGVPVRESLWNRSLAFFWNKLHGLSISWPSEPLLKTSFACSGFLDTVSKWQGFVRIVLPVRC